MTGATSRDTGSLSREDVLMRAHELLARLRPEDEIARENIASAAGAARPDDPRLGLVSEIASRLQGSMLSPEDRAEIITRGETRGIRRFDSNLLIAMVQDRVRRGERPMGLELAHTRMPSPSAREAARGIAPASRIILRLIMALLGAAVLTILAAGWLTN